MKFFQLTQNITEGSRCDRCDLPLGKISFYKDELVVLSVGNRIQKFFCIRCVRGNTIHQVYRRSEEQLNEFVRNV